MPIQMHYFRRVGASALIASTAACGGLAGPAADDTVRVDDNGAYPSRVVLEPANLVLSLCSSMQMTARTDPLVRNARFIWRSSDPNVLSVDGTGHVTSVAPGVATISAAWSGDSTIVASQTVPVRTIIPGILSIEHVRQSGTNELLPLDSLSGDITVRVGMFVYAYFGGEVQLLINDVVVGRAPYPVGCPQRSEFVNFTGIKTANYPDGAHTLTARLIPTSHGQAYQTAMPIWIRNQATSRLIE